MDHKRILFIYLCFLVGYSIAQTPIDVIEANFKVGGFAEEVMYYGFAEGDQIIFTLEIEKGKELKEVEIVELPSAVKFSDFKTSAISNKIINVSQTGIYKFRLANASLAGRICKVKIQRVPGSDTSRSFDTNVLWREVRDTAYTPVEEKFLIKSDTFAQMIVDQVTKISSKTALNGNPNKNIVDFTLPANSISWSYYIGVGQEGKEAYDASLSKYSGMGSAVSGIVGYGPMAGLAMYGINVFLKTQGEDNVKYYFIGDDDNVNLFKSGQAFYHYKQGDVINDASQMKKPLLGKVYLGLENDNIRDAIEVLVKVTAVVVTQEWGTRTVQKMSFSERMEPYLKSW